MLYLHGKWINICNSTSLSGKYIFYYMKQQNLQMAITFHWTSFTLTIKKTLDVFCIPVGTDLKAEGLLWDTAQ
jgi:hypothetical protein